ncbi:MAG: methyltransferase domain-containing protein [Candidatus Dadabacteria bacterium]|nr:MAG: methyltransferase domain-containing protein [Candidatus Dadabacteria bacterium]
MWGPRAAERGRAGSRVFGSGPVPGLREGDTRWGSQPHRRPRARSCCPRPAPLLPLAGPHRRPRVSAGALRDHPQQPGTLRQGHGGGQPRHGRGLQLGEPEGLRQGGRRLGEGQQRVQHQARRVGEGPVHRARLRKGSPGPQAVGAAEVGLIPAADAGCVARAGEPAYPPCPAGGPFRPPPSLRGRSGPVVATGPDPFLALHSPDTSMADRRRPDHYARRARREGLPARSVYKLEEIDARVGLFRGVRRVLDLGCRPGSWSAYARRRCGPDAAILGVDIEPVDGFPGIFLQQSVEDLSPDGVIELLEGPPQVVLSDMAPATMGNKGVDHLRQVALAEAALDVAGRLLAPGGSFVCKVFDGSDANAFVDAVRSRFTEVRRIRPFRGGQTRRYNTVRSYWNAGLACRGFKLGRA